MDARIEQITSFWRDAGPDRWYAKDEAFDRAFRERFLDLHYSAARRECDGWAETAQGSLALMILLDQFPRNCFRGGAHMYATDPLARHFARQAIDAGRHRVVELALRVFLVLPFMHSETLADQDLSIGLCAELDDLVRRSAAEHRDIVARFGRFPHRNPMLGRETTPAERLFLDGDGFKG